MTREVGSVIELKATKATHTIPLSSNGFMVSWFWCKYTYSLYQGVVRKREKGNRQGSSVLGPFATVTIFFRSFPLFFLEFVSRKTRKSEKPLLLLLL